MGKASRKKAARQQAELEAAQASRHAGLWSSGAWKLGAAGAGVLVIGALVALLALSSSESGSGEGGSGDGSVTVSSGGEGEVSSFTVGDVDGQSISRPTGKPGALFFMAGWCGTCIPEAEALAELKEEHGEGIELLAVSIDPSDTAENIDRFIETTGASSYPFYWDKGGQLTQRYSVQALDTTLVYDRNGRVVFRDSAPTDRETLLAALEEAGLS